MLFMVFRWSDSGGKKQPCKGAYYEEIAKRGDGSPHCEWFIDIPDLVALIELIRKLQEEKHMGGIYVRPAAPEAKWNFLDLDDQW